MDLKSLKQLTQYLNVLYVEDDVELREKTAMIFGNLFSLVDTAVDGEDGLHKYNQFYEKNQTYYDLVISDINMPNMNGLELAKNIYTIHPEQYLMVISAYNDSETLEELIDLGIDSFIHKPIDLSALVIRLSKVVHALDLAKKVKRYTLEIEELNNELTASNEVLEQKVKDRTRQIEQQLYYDSLTGLKSNHSLIEDLISKSFVAMFLVDIDEFSNINNVYGYQYGQEILKQFAQCLSQFNISERFSLYRMGFDKFVLVEFDRVTDFDIYDKDVLELRDFVSNYIFVVEDIEFNIEATIGVSLGQENSIVAADMALNHAKKHKIRYQLFNSEIDISHKFSSSLDMKKTIKRAIESDNVFPVFQPIVNSNGEIIKYEVLMRIRNEANEVLTPWHFLEIAIQSKQYNELAKIMFEKTFAVMIQSDKEFSLNLSYEDIYNYTIVKYLEETLQKYKGIGDRVILELLETEAVEDTQIMEEFTSKVSKYGVRIAIDDFGTGYSNFSHILDLKPQYVKIDGVFIKNIIEDHKSQAIVKSIVSFARELDMKVIAEFVHNQEVFEWVRDIGIDQFQGYYFSAPLEQI